METSRNLLHSFFFFTPFNLNLTFSAVDTNTMMNCFPNFTRNILEALFNRKFRAKSKLHINGMLTRIENIKKRRAWVNKYLRNQACELLRIGNDSDAFTVVVEIYQHQDRSLCYDFLERFCTLVLDQLTPMTHQRECPEECKEAVSSLMYAAARFGDLPELRKLRSLFYKKYWTSVESFVNKEFLDLLESDRPPIQDTTINRLMQEIAQENGMEWHPKSLDNESYSTAQFSKVDNVEYEAFSFPLDGSDDDEDKEPGDDHTVKQTENRLKTTGLVFTSRKTSTTLEKSLKMEPNKKGNPGAGFDIQSNNIRKHGIDKEKAFSFRLDGSGDVQDEEPGDDVVKQTEDGFRTIGLVSTRRRIKDEKAVVVRGTLKNNQQRRGSRMKIHPKMGCLPDPVTVEEPKRTANRLPKHVHPKLPDYDVLKARLQEIRRESSISMKDLAKSRSLHKHSIINKQHVAPTSCPMKNKNKQLRRNRR